MSSAYSSTVQLASPVSTIGVAVATLFVVVLLGLVGAFAVIVVANRADPDPSGRRPLVVYLFGASFVLLWTALIGSTAVVSSLVQLIGRSTALGFGERHPVGDAVARGVVLGGLIFLVSLITLVIHAAKGRALVAEEESPTAPALRTQRSYASAVCFVAILVLVIAFVVGVYSIFQIVAPGVFQAHGRVPAVRSAIDAAWVVIATAIMLASHLPLARPGFRFRGGQVRVGTVEETVIVVEEPPTNEPS